MHLPPRLPVRALVVRPATWSDAIALAARLRPADVQELAAASGMAPTAALEAGVKSSVYCRAALLDGVVFSIFGVVSKREFGAAWMLASDQIAQSPRLIVNESSHWIRQLHRFHDVLANVVDERNTLHVRWLKWCGFSVIRRIESFGPQRLPFLQVMRRSDDPFPNASASERRDRHARRSYRAETPVRPAPRKA